ncbi:MAG: hypothetical protein FJ098_14755, partial [Deltaproteobacteria bacterium]|nr:hypothetical protein [Deltaproteobacteria bacterium]
ASSHTHDDRYFTETELSGGALDGRYYNETELNNGALDSRYVNATGDTMSGSLAFTSPATVTRSGRAAAPTIIASSNMSFSQDDRSGWTHIETLGDDQCHSNIPLGFTYTGFGANTSTVSLSSNGVLFLGSGCSTALSNAYLPTFISNDPALFFFWDDLADYGTGEFAQFTTMGVGGGRVFMLWFVMRTYDPTCTAPIQVMIEVHEGSNLVKATYQGVNPCNLTKGGSATFGFQTAGGSAAEAISVGYNVPILDDNANRQFMSFHPPK